MLQPPRLVHMMASGDRHGSYGRGPDFVSSGRSFAGMVALWHSVVSKAF